MAEGIENYFVCIGAQKAGTTWLAKTLARHPGLFFTPVKELHYFDHISGITQHLSNAKRRSRYRKYHQRLWTQLHRWPEHRSHWSWYRDYMRDPIDDDWYQNLFRHRGDATFAGEATPEYALIGEAGFQHIKTLAPNARLLFIMRNPVTQCWSQVLHHARSNGTDVSSASEDEIFRLADTERFRALSDYLQVVDGLERVFAREQVRFEFYEDVHSDHGAALDRLCAFIGLDPFPADFAGSTKRINPSQSVPMPHTVRAHFQEKYRDMAAEIGARFARLPGEWVEEFAL